MDRWMWGADPRAFKFDTDLEKIISDLKVCSKNFTNYEKFKETMDLLEMCGRRCHALAVGVDFEILGNDRAVEDFKERMKPYYE